jgi:diguanylate cyclase (GGDEF)-like protein/PAS domain S-box-containing protein
MAIFLILSGLADSYALSPGHDLPPGGWFDLIWSALLAIPILIAATWKGADESESDGSTRSQRVIVDQVFPLLYPLTSFLILTHVHGAYPVLSIVVFALASMTFAARMLIIQHREGQSKESLRQSEKNYQLLFDSNPVPMWVFDRKSLMFLAVNEAACRQYGFSNQEFLTITIADIRPEEDIPALLEATAEPSPGLQESTIWRHRKKNGTIIVVEIVGHNLDFHGIEAELIAARDVTERKKAEELAQRLASIVEFSQDAIIGKGLDGAITSWNRAAEKMYGYTSAEVMGRDLSFLLSAERQAELRVIMERIRKGLAIECLETQRLTKAGSVLDVSLSISAIKDASGRVTGASTTARDITARKRTEEQLKLQSAALEAAANSIVITDSHGAIMWVNDAFTKMTGYSKEEVLGNNPRLLKSGNQPESYYGALWSTISSGKIWRGEIVNRRKDGTTYSEEMTITPVIRDSGNPANRYFIAIKQDITARKIAERRVQYLAYYDDLTGLANRALLQDRLAKALAAARRQEHKVALLFLDLDGFKDVNDSLGHSVGDLLLQEVAERLKTWVREQDTVARLGGDEFLITVTNVKDVPDAAVAAERLMDAMTAGFVIQGHSLSIGCCIGISIFPEHGADCETLIKNADAAMYVAKADGRNNFRFFTEDMNGQVAERLALEHSLRLALPQNELFLMYQPQMDIATGKITGLEALLRWQHPKLGLVPPDRFIRIAENCGLIVAIGEWVLRTACSQARKWQDEGLPAVTVAVNVSAVQFRQEGFCALVRKVLHETGLAPQYLELELTESLLLANAELMLSVVQQLRDTGVTLAIDDFGTGYSNFASLRKFGVTKLKIDRSFIQDVAVNTDDAAITAAIISMAKSLRLKVIAEGVEDEAQMSFLRAHHCDELQGYYFSKPLALDKVADKLRDDSNESQAERMPVGTNRDNKPHEMRISLMSIGLALLVSADPVAIQQFSLALRELSISPDSCKDAASAALLLKRRKFDAVIVDLQLGEQSGLILDEVRLSSSNKTAVTFGIGDHDAAGTVAFRKKAQLVFERPLSAESIHKTLKPAYGLILQERRRYFRYPVSIPVIIRRQSRQELRCNSVNISGGGMALSTHVPLVPGENVGV